MESILITGGSGKIGRELIAKIDTSKFEIRVLSRSKKSIDGCKVFIWDIDQDYIAKEALENLDHVIHLSGSDVSAGRWTSKRKQEIKDSRIKSLDLINSNLTAPLKTLLSASGISYYGTRTVDTIFEETDIIKFEQTDFLAEVTHQWEAAAKSFSAERTVILRTPVVLSRTGGALEKLRKPIKSGLGSALGNGKQWMPWVHVDDLVQAYLAALSNDNWKGTYNVCAPEHATNIDFTEAVALQLGKKLWAPKVPTFLLKMMFGEMSGIILKGSRVSGKKVEERGFKYHYEKLEKALNDLLK
jgi:uncharacterized protein (TIGR01777 family)